MIFLVTVLVSEVFKFNMYTPCANSETLIFWSKELLRVPDLITEPFISINL